MFLSSTILWILLGKARGGSFAKLAQADIKRQGVIFAVLVARVALYSGYFKISASAAGVIHTAVFSLLVLVLYDNLHITGMWLATAGSVLNATVIAANGGRMPVAYSALVKSGLPAAAESLAVNGSLTHVLLSESTELRFLGDLLWFKWPWGSGVVFSVGDILLIAGMFFAVQSLMGAGRSQTIDPDDPH
jgi:hypothetical protein